MSFSLFCTSVRARIRVRVPVAVAEERAQVAEVAALKQQIEQRNFSVPPKYAADGSLRQPPLHNQRCAPGSYHDKDLLAGAEGAADSFQSLVRSLMPLRHRNRHNHRYRYRYTHTHKEQVQGQACVHVQTPLLLTLLQLRVREGGHHNNGLRFHHLSPSGAQPGTRSLPHPLPAEGTSARPCLCTR
jgi:hypothetical protein